MSGGPWNARPRGSPHAGDEIRTAGEDDEVTQLHATGVDLPAARVVRGRPSWRPARLTEVPVTAAILLVRAYQLVISPLSAPTCRFHPSCSTYAVTALRRFGLVRGGWLAVRRLGRCHPWSDGGIDDVPERVGRAHARGDAQASGAHDGPIEAGAQLAPAVQAGTREIH